MAENTNLENTGKHEENNTDNKGLNTAKPAMGNTNSKDSEDLQNADEKNNAGENLGGPAPENTHKELADDPKDVKGRRNGSDSNAS